MRPSSYFTVITEIYLTCSMFRFQVDRIYSRAACVPTFWKKLMTITGMGEQWITARIKEKGECKCISRDALKDLILTHPDETRRALGYVDEATTDLFHRLSKGSLLALRSWQRLQILRTFSRKMLSRELRGRFLFRLGPSVGNLGCHWLYPFARAKTAWIETVRTSNSWIGSSEFVYKGADYKRKVSEVSNAWNKTCRLKGVAIGPATTPEYVEWRGRGLMITSLSQPWKELD
ncbi:hypothetical protein CXB51_035266 [Gossypium anomalum]|uniref:Uncharacterized protein n=1 Tax=Gossypium anomalum TaxID=47600 RepID=A0A8J5Y1C0_9ROSI|nr:hypothetical protein CXB51_035266 [Gossypium anomalum]